MGKSVIIGDALSHPQGLIVHGCNCQGVMGSGIAKAVKERYPVAFQEYYNQYTTNPVHGPGGLAYDGLKLGQIIPVEVEANKWIVNAMTQHLYGTESRKVNYDAVAVCFEFIRDYARQVADIRGFRPDIVYPLIGAGLGGGNWRIIDTIIDETLAGEFNQYIYGFEDDLRNWGLVA